MAQREIGGLLIAIGLVISAIGLITWAGGLSWFGHLPGDVRIEGERSRVYLPITSMVIASVVLTIVVNLLRRWF